jgi:hypothetical protein
MLNPFDSDASTAAIVTGTLQICVVTGLVLMLAASPLGEPHTQRPEQPAAHNHERSNPAPPTVKGQDRPKTDDATAANKTREDYQHLSETAPVWIQAFAAVVSLGFTLYMVRYARKGWEAANKNADAAGASANFLRLSQRAQVNVVVAVTPPNSHIPLRLLIRSTNHGETIAHLQEFVFIFHQSPLDKLDFAAPPVFEVAGAFKQRLTLPLYRGQDFEHIYQFPADSERHLKNPDTRIVVYGYVTYSDIFDRDVVHTTRFGVVFEPQVWNFTLIEMPGYNSAD